MSEALLIAPNAIQYKSYDTAAPRYRYRKVPLYQASSASITIPVGSTSLCQFKLAADVFNLSKSYIGYTASLPASGDAGAYTYIATDAADVFNSIQLTDAGQFAIMTVANANKFSRTGRKLRTSTSEFLANDGTEGLNKVGSLASPDTLNSIGTANSCPTIETQYVKKLNANAVSSWNRRIPLNAFHDSIFALDRDQYFGRDMYINIMAGMALNFAWLAGTGSPATGAAPVTGNLTLSNFYLYLAVEVNEHIARPVREKYMAGQMTYTIPYPYMVRLPSNGSTTVNLIHTIQPTQGIAIRRILYECYNGNETVNLTSDSTNINGSKIVSYQTTLDSQPLQDNRAYCDTTNLDDWRENSKFCRGTPIYDSVIYQKNWFHCDSFEPEPRPGIQLINLKGGLPLDQPRTWGIDLTLADTDPKVHYITFIVEREMTVSPLGGFQFDLSKGAPSPVPSPSVM